MSDLDVLSTVKKCTDCCHFKAKAGNSVCDYHGFRLENADSVFCESYNERDHACDKKDKAYFAMKNLEGVGKDAARIIVNAIENGKIPHIKTEF